MAPVASQMNQSRRSAGVVAGIVIGLLLAACGPEVSSPQDSQEAQSPEAGSTGESDKPTHTCANRRLGEGGVTGKGDRVPRDWRDRSRMIGPLGLYRISEVTGRPARDFEAVTGDRFFRAYVVYVILEKGRDATIRVAAPSRDLLSILTDPARGGGDPEYRLDDGDPSLRLIACPNRDTQFLEAFVVAGAQCGRVLVKASGEPTRRAVLGFGKRGCN